VAPHGTHVLFMQDPRTLNVEPTYYLGGTHTLTSRGTHIMFMRDPCGTHVLFRWDPCTILVESMWDPRTL